MIIEQPNKDIFSFPSNHVLVNTVNCVGVMGKGIALEFKKRFPQLFKDYQLACKNKNIEIGKCWLWKNEDLFNQINIICFLTKLHWKNDSKYEYIEKGLISLKELVLSNNLDNIVIPKLGYGCGGLDWNKVKSIIYKHLNDSQITWILTN